MLAENQHEPGRPLRREGRYVSQQGQVFELKRRDREGESLWAYRYRVAGRDSKRVQQGGFTSEYDAAVALELSSIGFDANAGSRAV
jgi:hypothetical protein